MNRLTHPVTMKFPEPQCLLHTGIAAFELTVGTALTAIAFGMFIIPQHFASAGVTGLSTLLCEFTPLSLSQTIFAINLAFLALAFMFVGRTFAAKTIISSIMFPLMLDIFSISGTCPIHSPAISILISGILLGIGSGMVLRSGASSGGFAILGVILQKKLGIPVAITMNITDAALIMICIFKQSLFLTVCGILVITLSAMMVGIITSAERFIPASKLEQVYSDYL